MIMTSCGSDDDEPNPGLTSAYLEATTWEAQLAGTDYPTQEPVSDHFVMVFLTKESGECIPAYGETDYAGSFSYHITKDMITFSGALIGSWSVVERTDKIMVLRSFRPNEFKLVLTRI